MSRITGVIIRFLSHSSMIDSAMLPPNSNFQDLAESYVIFITEQDVLGLNAPIYHIDRIIEESGEPFCDGEHIDQHAAFTLLL